jgi:hypothetical protein
MGPASETGHYTLDPPILDPFVFVRLAVADRVEVRFTFKGETNVDGKVGVRDPCIWGNCLGPPCRLTGQSALVQVEPLSLRRAGAAGLPRASPVD